MANDQMKVFLQKLYVDWFQDTSLRRLYEGKILYRAIETDFENKWNLERIKVVVLKKNIKLK
jgi:hypothetical protein